MFNHLHAVLYIVTDIKVARLRRMFHVKRMDSSEMVKRIIENTSLGRKVIARPRCRCMGCVLEDIKTIRLLTVGWLLGTGKSGGKSLGRPRPDPGY